MTAREQEFLEYVQSGGLVETDDWMPDEYRARLVKFIEMHGNSELMGVLPERDWILRAPTLQRKLALTAKIQDEVGHCQLIYRVVEDLGKPREQCLDDLIAGKSKFHNVFHYPTKSWGDVGVIAWLVDAAAIISQKALLKCSYAPYARVMKKVCWEESFHILHGRDTVLAMVTGTPEQFELVQEALELLMGDVGKPALQGRKFSWLALWSTEHGQADQPVKATREEGPITVDFRGSGKSRDRAHPKGPFSIRQFAADVHALLHHLGAAPAHVVGLSLGGMVAFQLVVDFPDDVASLAIVNSGPAVGEWLRKARIEAIKTRGSDSY